MGILLAITAAGFTASQNFLMRRSLEHGSTLKTYLTIQCLCGFFFMVFMNPIRAGVFTITAPICFLGLLSGSLLAIMVLCIGYALQTGPSGLTYVAINSSNVFPSIIMTSLFGASYGFAFTSQHFFGSFLILVGLFLALKDRTGFTDGKKWLFYISIAFLFHIFFLLILQFRSLLITSKHLPDFFRIMNQNQATSPWFLPCVYLGGFIFHSLTKLLTENIIFSKTSILYGLFGGIADSLSTFTLILATEIVSKIENAMLFPVFSVFIIFFCNLWGAYFYQEKIKWKASQICMAGLMIGCIEWKALFKLFF